MSTGASGSSQSSYARGQHRSFLTRFLPFTFRSTERYILDPIRTVHLIVQNQKILYDSFIYKKNCIKKQYFGN